MPRVTWVSAPEVKRHNWSKDFVAVVESKRVKCKPTYQQIADAAGCSRQALANKFKEGNFTLEEFSGIATLLEFSDAEILKLVKKRT